MPEALKRGLGKKEVPLIPKYPNLCPSFHRRTTIKIASSGRTKQFQMTQKRVEKMILLGTYREFSSMLRIALHEQRRLKFARNYANYKRFKISFVF